MLEALEQELVHCCQAQCSLVGRLAVFLQERYYELLLSGQFINEEEREILRWGRNAKVNVPTRFKASGKHAETYKHATAVECLVSYFGLLQWFPMVVGDERI